MKVEWSEIAESDLDAHVRHIASDDFAAAFRIEDRILEAVAHLVAQPRMGRASAVEGLRELVISRTPYIAAYRFEAERIFIVRLVHDAQLRPD